MDHKQEIRDRPVRISPARGLLRRRIKKTSFNSPAAIIKPGAGECRTCINLKKLHSAAQRQKPVLFPADNVDFSKKVLIFPLKVSTESSPGKAEEAYEMCEMRLLDEPRTVL
jgi:hypothetical protein